MSRKKPDLELRYANRRKRVIKQIKGEAALFCSAPETTVSRDLLHDFHQNTDFFYLTGFAEPQAALLLLGSTRGPRSILFLRDRDAEQERWVGERLGLKRAKRKFKVDEVRHIEELPRSLPELLSNSRVLHYAPGCSPDVDSLVWSSFKSPLGPRINFPNTLSDSRLITSQMRAVKDRQEIQTLRHACDITAEGFFILAQRLGDVKSERHGAQLLESHFARLGAQRAAFPTIVASGRNATVLHHKPRFQPLWRRELVLIDAGAEFNGYAADITRTLPVLGVFSEPQAAVYDIVYEAQQAAIHKARPNSTLDAVHKAAVQVITRGLVSLGVLEGRVTQLVSSEAYRRYFMHRTGHWLGLDVHDISPVYCDEFMVPPWSRPLESGNVFTVEPGLYFDPKDKTIPAEYRGIGVRIEDDLLITNSGCDVLTSRMPSERAEIEAIMRNA